MNLSKLTKVNLISELEKRSLPTTGLKDELCRRLKEAIEKENETEIDNQEENYDSEDENVDEYNGSEETLIEDENIKEADPASALTVDDAINMKGARRDAENYSMIVNINDDDDSTTTTAININKDFDTLSNNRDGNIDQNNGEHEVIEISEEVVIDDEDNNDNDNNFNVETISNNEQLEQQEEQLEQGEHQHRDEEEEEDDKDELELGESRDDDSCDEKEKINLWVYNVAEDVKAVDLKELFGKFGKVISAKVIMNSKNATGNCFGCIELSTNEDVDNCIKNLDKTTFRGNIITMSKTMCDTAPVESKIQRNISPVSSTDSWGGSGKNKEKSLSIPMGETVIEINDDDDNTNNNNNNKDEERKFRPPFRGGGRGNYRGNNYIAARDSNRNDGGSYDNRGGRDYRRGNYGTRNNDDRQEAPRQSYRSNNYGNDSGRPRESNYPRRDVPRGGGGRDDYGSSSSSRPESRYQPVNRDRRPSPRDGGYNNSSNDRPKGGRYYENEGRSVNKYQSSYEPQDSYERRSYNKPRPPPYSSDRAPIAPLRSSSRSSRDRDYHNHHHHGAGGPSSSSMRDDVSFKRPRIADNVDDMYHHHVKRRRDDYSPDNRRGAGDKYRSSPPPPIKRSFYYEKEFHRSDYNNRGDKRDSYLPPASQLSGGGSRGDYNPRKIMPSSDYNRRSSSNSRPVYDKYSPSERRSSRNHNYKDSYPSEFGGRSRNYDH